MSPLPDSPAPHDPLEAFLLQFQDCYRAGERPEVLTSVFGEHQVSYYGEDDPELAWAVIGFTLPQGMQAALTNGNEELVGIRIFLQD